jgi:hypothetical protein
MAMSLRVWGIGLVAITLMASLSLPERAEAARSWSTGIHQPTSTLVDEVGGDPVFEISWRTAAKTEDFVKYQQFTTYVENVNGLFTLPSSSSTDGWMTTWRASSKGVSVMDTASKDTSHPVQTHRVRVRATNGMTDVELRHSPGFPSTGPQRVVLPLYPTAGGGGNSGITEAISYWEETQPAYAPSATCSIVFLCQGLKDRVQKWYLRNNSVKADGDSYAGHVLLYTVRVDAKTVKIVDAYSVMGTTQPGTHNKGNVNIALEGWNGSNTAQQTASTGWIESPDSMRQDRAWHRIPSFVHRTLTLGSSEKMSARVEFVYDRGGASDPRGTAITEKRAHPE